MKKAGVLISSKTSRQFVQEAVESVLAQTYSDFDFLIIDDAGPVQTWEYLQSLKDPRVRLIRHNECQGISVSLNEGIAALQTEYVFNLDADDVMHPKRLEKQLQFFEQNPYVTVLGSAMELMDKQGKSLYKIQKVPTAPHKIAYQMLWSSAFNHPTIAYHRCSFMRTMGYDPNYRTSMDYHLHTHMVPDMVMGNLRDALVRYRVHETQASRIFETHDSEIVNSRLAYRSKMSQLTIEFCRDDADIERKMAFYASLTRKFPGQRRDLARRFLRDLIKLEKITKKQIQFLFQLHWRTAAAAKLQGII